MSDIDTAAVDGLKVLDPKRPIREADIRRMGRDVRFVPQGDICCIGVVCSDVKLGELRTRLRRHKWGSKSVIDDPETWWQDNTQRAQSLIDDIKMLAERARARGFQTTEYILSTAIAELLKEIENQQKRTNRVPEPTERDEGAQPQITKPDTK